MGLERERSDVNTGFTHALLYVVVDTSVEMYLQWRAYHSQREVHSNKRHTLSSVEEAAYSWLRGASISPHTLVVVFYRPCLHRLNVRTAAGTATVHTESRTRLPIASQHVCATGSEA